jgi:hypothetical protein
MGQFTRFTGSEEVDVPAQTLHTLSYKVSIRPTLLTVPMLSDTHRSFDRIITQNSIKLVRTCTNGIIAIVGKEVEIFTKVEFSTKVYAVKEIGRKIL